jgi:hypothetical protein
MGTDGTLGVAIDDDANREEDEVGDGRIGGGDDDADDEDGFGESSAKSGVE